MISEYRIPITSVVAVTPSWGIGMRGTLPWAHAGKHLTKDLAYFRAVTKQCQFPDKNNAVIMGRLTWESIPHKNRPLSGRTNIIVSTTMASPADCANSQTDPVQIPPFYVVPDFKSALGLISSNERLRTTIEKAVVIGGASLFEESMFHPWFQMLHLTQVADEFESDVFLPKKTISYLSSQDLSTSVAEDWLVEDGVRYRIIEFKPVAPVAEL